MPQCTPRWARGRGPVGEGTRPRSPPPVPPRPPPRTRTQILVDPIALHITCMLALQQIAPALSTLAAGAAVAVVMLPLGQVQSVHDMSSLSIGATVCMAVAVGATLLKLLALPGSRLHETTLLPPPETRAIEALVASMNL